MPLAIDSLAARLDRDFPATSRPPLSLDDPESRAHCAAIEASYGAQLTLARELLAGTADDTLRGGIFCFIRAKNRLLTLLTCLLPRETSALSTLLESEAALIYSYAYFAQTDPFPEVRQAFEYLALDHLDHLGIQAKLLWRLEKLDPSGILGKIPYLNGGRPFLQQSLAMADILKGPLNNPLDPLTWVHLLSMKPLEILNHRRLLQALSASGDPEARQVGLALSEVEEQHVAMLSSFEGAGGFERFLLGQFALTGLLSFLSSIEHEPILRKEFLLMLSFEEEALRACLQLLGPHVEFDLSPFLRLPAELPPARTLPDFLDWTLRQPKRSQGKLFVTMIEEDSERPKKIKKAATTKKLLESGG